MQTYRSGAWRTLSTSTFAVPGDNSTYLYLVSANKNVKYRFVANFASDTYNTKAPTAKSKTIIID